MDFMTPANTDRSRVRVLMLHGHGQSGQFFQCKTRCLQRPLQEAVFQALPQDFRKDEIDTVDFYYPTAPWTANPDRTREESNNQCAWGYGDHIDGVIRGLDSTVEYLAWYMEQHGPFTGIIGFSAGASLTAVITSLLEKKKPLCGFPSMEFHPRLKFAICISGYKLDNPFYDPIYASKIETPTLHVIGAMDAVVTPKTSLRLSSFCQNPSFFGFHGTHYVPKSNEFLATMGCFIRGALGPITEVSSDSEEEWEDCDV